MSRQGLGNFKTVCMTFQIVAAATEFFGTLADVETLIVHLRLKLANLAGGVVQRNVSPIIGCVKEVTGQRNSVHSTCSMKSRDNELEVGADGGT